MKQLFAEVNHARWIVRCPVCAEQGNLTAVQVKPGDVFVCPTEYPDMLAMTFIPNPRKAGAFNQVPDDELRKAAHQAALAAGDAFEVIFPAEKEAIEATLRPRLPAFRNWVPGETLQDLQQENAERELS